MFQRFKLIGEIIMPVNDTLHQMYLDNKNLF